MIRRFAIGILFSAVGASGAAEWFQEDFASTPGERGWMLHGATSLFPWDAEAQRLEVTWDSSQVNSYCYLNLPTELSRADDFQASFDLSLSEAQAGSEPAKPFSFELGIGFFNLMQATNSGFVRGSGTGAPNLVEFDYFPDTGFGATVWPSVSGTNGLLNYNGPSDYTLLALEMGICYHVLLKYTANDQILTLNLAAPEIDLNRTVRQPMHPEFSDFRVTAFGICSYSDAGAGGSLFARGWVDNIEIRYSAPLVVRLVRLGSDTVYRVEFEGRRLWQYQLERCLDLETWESILPIITGEEGTMRLEDRQPPARGAFYRIKSWRSQP